ncbi:MAG: nucleoside deaminase [Ignavibacteriota bacterium]|nr:MAG: nucleoside deaminase [Chlorobiota bacterium]MBE7476603.1 nucleoside deaminase [Ignavibacteriales bacterium]MBL1123743.1 nucleoside deaminase [Ignavibacteriota bacterium]MCE7855630.1 nucleoside deaminase [Ignavibacteria bacterium CHB3]MEB2297003.1 nucleoside deaminase [Ignavibacteria bacterium]GJQ42106.1 MAG: hypothetical protein JETCAE03_16040 [Ignavibacteriaceae bacterium]
MKTDNYYMDQCEKIGKAASLKGNPAVGALILKDDEIISEAEEASKNKNDITCHAEIEAIRIAVRKLKSADLSGCTMFSTHEPCIMCSYVIRFHKIKKVVFQHAVNYLGGFSSSMPLLISEEVPAHWSKPPVIVQFSKENE